MDKVAYKCVTIRIDNRNNLKYYSAMKGRIPKDYCLEYSIGKTTKPKVGKIYVFDTYQNALAFLKDNSHRVSRIMIGFATNIGRPQFIGEVDCVETFWKLRNRRENALTVSKNCPLGTLTCDSFTPTKFC